MLPTNICPLVGADVIPVPPLPVESAVPKVREPLITWFPVVVAPPDMVRPPICVPLPMVEEA
jgi:hypothetical protein